MKTTNHREFNLQLDKFINKMEIDAELALKKIALDLYRKIVEKTPVATGLARSSWVVGINGRASERLSAAPFQLTKGQSRITEAQAQGITNSSTRRAESAINKGVRSLKDFVVISNYQPYVALLEDGTTRSRQGPAGFVALSIQEIQKQIKKGNF